MTLEELIEKYQAKKHKRIRRIGGGYYADVYKVNYEKDESAVIKVYKTRDVMEKERDSIELLSKHSLALMPTVRWIHKTDNSFGRDLLCMNFLEGVIGGEVFFWDNAKRKKLADSVVNNLIAFHNVQNPDGFGEINSDIRYKTFNEYYRIRAEKILGMAESLEREGQLTAFVTDILRKAYSQFDRIFRLPITEASLIHGDYNMWNIMVDKKQCKVKAIIDPCGCMWADSEYDLYQLNNANGKHLKLFETYAKKKGLSENCSQKMAFYELFTEIEHYYNSGYPVQLKLIKKQAKNLKLFLEI